MSKLEIVGCALVVFGLWGLYRATVERVRLLFGRAPRGFAGVLWREHRREESERAAFWQRVCTWAVIIGALVVAIVRLTS